MTKTMYLVRHGQTRFNLKHIVQGRCDSPLTEQGIAQAKATRDYFRKENISFDLAFTSTQERACDTLEIITDQKMPYKRLKDLRERDYGICEGERQYFLPWNSGRPEEPTMETVPDLLKRVNKAFRKIAEEIPDGQTALIVAHGEMLRRSVNDLTNLGLEHWGNCGVVKVTYEDGKFSASKLVEPAKEVNIPSMITFV